MTQTPEKKLGYRLFKSNQIILVGQAFILTAIEATDDRYRDTETYLFIFKQPTGIHFLKTRSRFNGVSRSIVSDDILLIEAKETGEEEAQRYLSAKREELGADALPYELEFTFNEVEPERLFYHTTRRGLFNLVRSIQGATECGELQKFLQQGRGLSQTSIEQTREEPTTLD